MRLFYLMNKSTVLAEGVEFTDKRCAINWINSKGGFNKITGMAFYDCIEHVIEMHASFDDNTIKWIGTEKNKKKSRPMNCDSWDWETDNICRGCNCWKMTRKNCS